MRQDPIEISHISGASRLGARRGKSLARDAASLSAPGAIDEAFARFEPAHPGKNPTDDGPTVAGSLVSELSAQLEAIDRQCAQLAALLRSVERGSQSQ